MRKQSHLRGLITFHVVWLSTWLASTNAGRAQTPTDPQVVRLIELLKDENRGLRVAARNALHEFGPRAVPALIEALSHKNRNIRLNALIILKNKWMLWLNLGPEAKKRAKKAVPALIRWLRDEDVNFRREAIELLGIIGPPGETVSELIEALRDPDAEVRRNVARALGNIGPGAGAAAATALMQRVQDMDFGMIGRCGGPSSRRWRKSVRKPFPRSYWPWKTTTLPCGTRPLRPWA